MYHSLFTLAMLAAIAGLVGEFIGANQRHLLIRQALYVSSAFFTALSIPLLLWSRPDAGAVIIAVLSGFRVINALRVLKGRMYEVYAYRVTRRSSLVLMLSQFVVLALWAVIGYAGPSLHIVLDIYGGILFAVAVVLLLSARRTLTHSHLHIDEQNLRLEECPTVSVCIPARNETADLAGCLQSILASTYPKFEVLVLDDCSQDRTSEIIKKFAHDGARFIKGEAPKDGWLAKNQAYEVLAEAASGDVLLFCGVDVRMDPDAIGRLIRLKLARKKTMLSVLPMRADIKAGAGIIQPIRYWWEIALPRRLFNRPPVLSTSWLIEAKALRRIGGFKAVDNMIIPEVFFARELVKKDGYSFVTASDELQITSVKSVEEQKATAIRVRYPQLRKRPEAVALLVLAESGLLLAPFVFMIAGFFVHLGLLWWFSIASVLLLEITHGLILKAWNPHGWRFGGFVISAFADICLLIISMLQYEFWTVTWKERNICIPVMHVIPHLPELKD